MSSRREDWIRKFLDLTENTEPPRTFRLWTAISVVAAALQRKCCLRWGSLDFYPNLYIVLVAPSGKARKGTAMIPGLKILEKVGIKKAANATTREALIKQLRMSGQSEIDASTGEINMHASLTVFSKELTVFLGYANRELMSDLCDWYDCDDNWKYETKTQGVDYIQGVFVNIIGATTPKLISLSMPQDAVGGGLTSRIIFVYERDKGKVVHIPVWGQKERELFNSLVIDLEKIHMLKGDYRITEEFADMYIDWRNEAEKKDPFVEPRFDGYFERRPTHLLKLSMIVSASHSDSMIIGKGDLERAIKILSEVEIKMPQTFAGLGKHPSAEVLNRVMAEIGSRGKVTFAELMSMFYYDVDKWQMENILKTLKASDFIDFSHEGTTETITYRR